MSSPERKISLTGRLPGRFGFAAVALSVALAGCTGVQPLYQDGGVASPTGYSSTSNELSRVAVEPQPTRTGQRIRNDLLFRLNGGADPGGNAGGDYQLALRVTNRKEDLLVRPELNRSTGRFVTIIVTYTLRASASDEVLTTGTVQRSAAIEVTDQTFAAERAELDAENRASSDVADSIRTELAAWFATRG
ncbi:LPS assembly lipoprotein LptE [Tepidamorphus sp. 3E244]|uniref:LPS assembly lipoprotein LptE n=1 Tax=Tepidamorphus sp. 3E244 TaxID=3385498 RepID=UPI0038FCC140